VKSEKVEDGDESGGRSCRGASGCSGRRIGDASTAPIHRGEGGAGSGEQIFRGSGRGPAGADFSPLSPLNFLSGLVWGTCWTCSYRSSSLDPYKYIILESVLKTLSRDHCQQC
jgi:hypothetical protein